MSGDFGMDETYDPADYRPMTFDFVGTKQDVGPQSYDAAVDLVLEELRQLMLSRHRKYGAENIIVGGVHGLIIRIQDKLARIRQDHKDCSFIGACAPLISLPDEASEDAWLDLGNYAGVIAIMLARGWWTLPMLEEKK